MVPQKGLGYPKAMRPREEQAREKEEEEHNDEDNDDDEGEWEDEDDEDSQPDSQSSSMRDVEDCEMKEMLRGRHPKPYDTATLVAWMSGETCYCGKGPSCHSWSAEPLGDEDIAIAERKYGYLRYTKGYTHGPGPGYGYKPGYGYGHWGY